MDVRRPESTKCSFECRVPRLPRTGDHHDTSVAQGGSDVGFCEPRIRWNPQGPLKAERLGNPVTGYPGIQARLIGN